MIILDASVLIAHLDRADALHDDATRTLERIAEHDLGASPITLAEVLVGPARAGSMARADAALRDLEIATVALAEGAPHQLAHLRAATGLRMPDCCVLLAATPSGQLTSSLAGIATFDRKLARAARALGHDVHDVHE